MPAPPEVDWRKLTDKIGGATGDAGISVESARLVTAASEVGLIQSVDAALVVL